MTALYFSRPPRPELAPFVSALWGVRGDADYTTEAVLPNGSVELMVNFGPPQEVVAFGEQRATQHHRSAWLAGLQSQRLVHASPRGVDHIAVSFLPGGAHAFFELPMSEVADQVVDLDHVIGAESARLRERLLGLPDDESRLCGLESWLLGRRLPRDADFGRIQRATRWLRGGSDAVSISELCERLGLSNRSVIAKFRRQIGTTPKVLGRIERFRSLLLACRETPEPRWSDLAAELGYADQSHLNREFRRMAGTTPTRYLERSTAPGAMVVDGD